jgi:hypothetical protein
LSGRLSFDEGVPTPEVGFPKVVVGLVGGRQAPQQSRHIQPPREAGKAWVPRQVEGRPAGIAWEVVWDGHLP